MKFNSSLAKWFAPVLAPVLVLLGCGAFLPSPSWQPQGASASTPEAIARSSVPVASAVNQAAQLGELVPGVIVPATVVDRYTAGYLMEIQRQIANLDARIAAHQQDPSKPEPTRSDWWVALALAAAAGGTNVFSFKSGQKAAGART